MDGSAPHAVGDTSGIENPDQQQPLHEKQQPDVAGTSASDHMPAPGSMQGMENDRMVPSEAGNSMEPSEHDHDVIDAEEAARIEKEALQKADALKLEGNQLYGQGKLEEAASKYNEAIAAAPDGHPASAVYFANLAACHLKLGGRATDAARACSDAIELDPSYSKAYMRRAAALEQLEDLDHALADAKKVLELEPQHAWAKEAIGRLEPRVKAKHEALKNEMLGKLKDLGNNILGRFGLSIDNFKAEQDPTSGGYSIKFQQ